MDAHGLGSSSSGLGHSHLPTIIPPHAVHASSGTLIMPYLGRGGSAITILEDKVIKVAMAWEPGFMAEHPMVFVPIIGVEHHPSGNPNQVIYAMPRLIEPNVEADLTVALTAGLQRLRTLWLKPAPLKPNWRSYLAAHLEAVVVQNKLGVNIRKLDDVIRRLPDETHPCEIHGDPTLANILKNEEGEWWWIDPMSRRYIPNDPHVDLGKLFQSCFEYERVLLGETNPTFHHLLSFDLADRANLDWQTGMLWCLIHMVRLLPYQETKVSDIYTAVFNDVKI